MHSNTLGQLGITEQFKFLSWLKQTSFFRDDFLRTLLNLGFDADEARTWAFSEAVNKADVVKLFQDYGQHEPELFERFIENALQQYLDIAARSRTSPSMRPGG